jgi:hypothetical protein
LFDAALIDGPEIWTEEAGAAFFAAFTRKLESGAIFTLTVTF